MSNVYNLEPQAFGQITFKTTFGDIDIELFTKQCPKATKNFIQLSLDGYYNGAIFERVEKDFIAVGGVREDLDDDQIDQCYKPFPDEFHSRLKFTRRGLLATANTRKNDNGPKFFFTLGPAPELQDKHTIFGRVKGNSVYSLVDLNECQVDDDFCPDSEQKITEVLVVENPMPDLVPRLTLAPKKTAINDESSSDSEDPLLKPKPDPSKQKKLSFNYDDDDDEDDDEDGVVPEVKANNQNDSEKDKEQLRSPRAEENRKSDERVSCDPKPESVEEGAANSEPEYSDADSKEKRLREIRAQIQSIKQKIEEETETKTLAERRRRDESDKQSITTTTSSHPEQVDPELRVASRTNKRYRERETLELVTNFKKKLKEASKCPTETNNTKQELIEQELIDMDDDLNELDKVDGNEWLKHKFVAEDDVRLAKDANTKDDDWYSIDDPRNRMNRRHERHDRDRHSEHRSERKSHSDHRRHHKNDRDSRSSRHHHHR